VAHGCVSREQDSSDEKRGSVSAKIKADEDTWRAELAEDATGPIIIFFCTTTNQRPYRVVEIESTRAASSLDPQDFSEEELRTLFDASRSLGAPKHYPRYDS
jgi:hypothetical protein